MEYFCLGTFSAAKSHLFASRMTGMALLAFKGGLISDFFSLLLKSPKKFAKNYDAGTGGARPQILADFAHHIHYYWNP